MLRKKRRLPTYPDGVVEIYREKDRQTDFGAKRNARSLDHMDIVATLAYQERSCREQDFAFAEQQGFTLSMKVRTPLCDGVDASCKAVVGRRLFDISHVNKSKRDMYLYVSSAGELEAVE